MRLLSADVDMVIDSGLLVNGVHYFTNGVTKRTVTVSFMDVPEYIEDAVLLQKLKDFEYEVKSPLVWKRDQGIYLGFRHVRVSLSATSTSLPYVVKVIDPLGKVVMLKVKHDHQMKVCNSCLSADHLYRDCPQLICRNCHEQGHVRHRCPKLGVSPPLPRDSAVVAQAPIESVESDKGDRPTDVPRQTMEVSLPMKEAATVSHRTSVLVVRSTVSAGARERTGSQPSIGRRHLDSHFLPLQVRGESATSAVVEPVSRRWKYASVVATDTPGTTKKGGGRKRLSDMTVLRLSKANPKTVSQKGSIPRGGHCRW
ncbi:uncharacterized protein LOC143228647 [Tachypleus tridentatus]|uniref:uncharacterized protein LOC143228647 n=1 Tax=Tachypleus tridentatus TaxID=6853 RepID=UPI003FD63FEA